VNDMFRASSLPPGSFKDVTLRPLVRADTNLGKKMTKSKGNVVDPLEHEGTRRRDAVRFTLEHTVGRPKGRDRVILSARFASRRARLRNTQNLERRALRDEKKTSTTRRSRWNVRNRDAGDRRAMDSLAASR